MPDKFEWISNPGVRYQAILGFTQYYITFPSILVDLSDPSKSFSEPSAFMASAMKKTSEGIPINYIVGHNFNSHSHAQTACEEDYARYGDTIPPDKLPPSPPPIPL